MPLAHFTKVFAVTDAKIAKLTADPAGGSATYAASIDVPGIKSVGISGSVEAKELRGDNQLLDKDVVITNVQIAVAHAKLSYDVLPVLVGGTSTDSGTTPNQKVTYDLLGTSRPSYFKLEAISASSDVVGGNQQFQFHKAIVSAFPEMGLAEEDYQIVSFTADCAPLLANSKWISAILNETAAVLT